MAEEEKPKKEKKAPPPDLVIPEKKPKLSKAERRALQEKQRAEKASKQQQPTDGGGGPAKPTPVVPKVESDAPSKPAPKATKPPQSSSASEEPPKVSTTDDKTIDLFSHLPQYQGKDSNIYYIFVWKCRLTCWGLRNRSTKSTCRRIHFNVTSRRHRAWNEVCYRGNPWW